MSWVIETFDTASDITITDALGSLAGSWRAGAHPALRFAQTGVLISESAIFADFSAVKRKIALSTRRCDQAASVVMV